MKVWSWYKNLTGFQQEYLKMLIFVVVVVATIWWLK